VRVLAAEEPPTAAIYTYARPPTSAGTLTAAMATRRPADPVMRARFFCTGRISGDIRGQARSSPRRWRVFVVDREIPRGTSRRHGVVPLVASVRLCCLTVLRCRYVGQPYLALRCLDLQGHEYPRTRAILEERRAIAGSKESQSGTRE